MQICRASGGKEENALLPLEKTSFFPRMLGKCQKHFPSHSAELAICQRQIASVKYQQVEGSNPSGGFFANERAKRLSEQKCEEFPLGNSEASANFFQKFAAKYERKRTSNLKIRGILR